MRPSNFPQSCVASKAIRRKKKTKRKKEEEKANGSYCSAVSEVACPACSISSVCCNSSSTRWIVSSRRFIHFSCFLVVGAGVPSVRVVPPKKINAVVRRVGGKDSEKL
eukprot:TRINITY_DN3448_c0_g1_i3.p1 TRINITY_DN3448_c0_g1~~TRINITY_DN3448_c0_g1_i3.p1  ORF type:complete len:108 (+),score=13.58 TRINITY_DN3448_c0_g1_i3:289-612(+)